MSRAQRTYTIQCGAPRTLYHCASCTRTFSETHHTPIAQFKTPIAIVVQVLAALTEGVGINAATRLYGISKNMSLSRLNHWLPGREAHSEVMQRTAEFHHQIADAFFPEADPVFHNATALHATVDMLDP